eukprot:1176346-Prorocentrum_minimum.AAC.3
MPSYHEEKDSCIPLSSLPVHTIRSLGCYTIRSLGCCAHPPIAGTRHSCDAHKIKRSNTPVRNACPHEQADRPFALGPDRITVRTYGVRKELAGILNFQVKRRLDKVTSPSLRVRSAADAVSLRRRRQRHCSPSHSVRHYRSLSHAPTLQVTQLATRRVTHSLDRSRSRSLVLRCLRHCVVGAGASDPPPAGQADGFLRALDGVARDVQGGTGALCRGAAHPHPPHRQRPHAPAHAPPRPPVRPRPLPTCPYTTTLPNTIAIAETNLMRAPGALRPATLAFGPDRCNRKQLGLCKIDH